MQASSWLLGSLLCNCHMTMQSSELLHFAGAQGMGQTSYACGQPATARGSLTETPDLMGNPEPSSAFP